MTKAELVEKISDSRGIKASVVAEVIEGFMTSVEQANLRGEEIFLRGFGKFGVVKRASKIGRNISKGTTVVIPEHMAPKFTAYKDYREKVKNGL